MNKKLFKILIINIFLILLSILAIEGIIWVYENLRIKANNERILENWPLPFHPGVKPFYFDIDYFPNIDLEWGRNPVGLDYKNKPIVLFGDSFAYGFQLPEKATLFYKLSEITKRPVYVRATAGWGIQHMLLQTRIDKFYEIVPEPEYVIYLMIQDHFRRLYCFNFLSGNLLNEKRYLRYKYENGKLVQITNSNPFLNILKKLYITNRLHEVYVNNVILNKKNYNNYSKFALEHFVESKQEMEKHWKNTKYVVLFYHGFYNEKQFTQDLEKQGFIVYSIPELVNHINLNAKEYNIEEGHHPNEKAWDLITPKIIEKLGL